MNGYKNIFIKPNIMPTPSKPKKAPRNQTLRIEPEEQASLMAQTLRLDKNATAEDLKNQIIHQDFLQAVPYLPSQFINLLIIDPPYNLTKQFGNQQFKKSSETDYQTFLHQWLSPLIRCLTPDASIYMCGDWQSSNAMQTVLEEYFIIRNRITWQREKGRGAKYNWKNCAEDIWFCTLGNDYYFNVDAVKLKKQVIAPYKDDEGKPKDWQKTDAGNFRLTHPANLWSDITIPFWSMAENTDHPTQKPEKLIAKLILASSKPDDVVFDPFLGSGTTAIVAKKLGRVFCGVEQQESYCQMAVKRLQNCKQGDSIQGYDQSYDKGVFLERNQ